MILAILQAIAALPTVLQFIAEFGKYMKSTLGDNYDKFLVDGTNAFRKLNEAKTPDEKLAAAQSIRDLIKRL